MSSNALAAAAVVARRVTEARKPASINDSCELDGISRHARPSFYHKSYDKGSRYSLLRQQKMSSVNTGLGSGMGV